MGKKPVGTKKPKSRLMLYAIVGCMGVLVLVVGLWLAVALPQLMKGSSEPVPQLTAEELAREKELKAKEAEKSASWENYHCNLMYKYYSGPEDDLPLAELVGLSLNADEAAVRERCRELLPAVRLMGGWPSDRRQWDNFVTCEGFDFVLQKSGNLTVRPAAEDLGNNEVAFGVPGKWFRKQKLVEGHTRKVGEFIPLVTQAGDRCVIVGVPRSGRSKAIWGRLVRTP